MFHGGAEEDRTPDLMTASHALSQLSYDPMSLSATHVEHALRTGGILAKLDCKMQIGIEDMEVFARVLWRIFMTQDFSSLRSSK